MLGRKRRLVLLAEAHFNAVDAKTAVGVLRYRPDEVVAVIDSTGINGLSRGLTGSVTGVVEAQTWDGNDMDTYADDLAALTSSLDLKNAIHVGHSTGGGEVARYIGRHGTKRVAKPVLVSAITPLMLKTPANPGGLPIEVFDQLRAGVLADRSQFFKDLSAPFFGANRPGSNVSQGVRDAFWVLSMQAGLKGAYDCIKVFSETDLTEDLKKFDVPTLILHGDDDQIVPIADSALLAAKIVKDATLKVIKGAPHGMPMTLKNEINAELLQFFRQGQGAMSDDGTVRATVATT